jgi:Flp pilus assembly protein CpaB
VAVSPSTKPREAGSPRPARRRIRRRLSLTHVLIAVVVILAFVLNLLVLQDRSSTTLVAVADRPLTAGSPLDPSTLRLVPVDAGFEGLSDLVTEEELADLDGWLLSRSISEGGLVDETAVVAPGSRSGLRSMSLPVPVEHASGGALAIGDRVDVISVTDGTAGYVATDLEVVSVADGQAGAIGTVSSYHVVVSVEAREALALAEALDRGSMEIVRSTGSETIDEELADGS